MIGVEDVEMVPIRRDGPDKLVGLCDDSEITSPAILGRKVAGCKEVTLRGYLLRKIHVRGML